MKKNFIVTTLVSISLFAWIIQSAIGGVICACASFFTKRKLESWEESKKD